MGQQYRLKGMFNQIKIWLIVPQGTLVTVHNITHSGLYCVHTEDGLSFVVNPDYLELVS